MSDVLSAFKDQISHGKFNFLISIILFLVAVALLLCGLVSPCVAGAIIFIGLALTCCSSC